MVPPPTGGSPEFVPPVFKGGGNPGGKHKINDSRQVTEGIKPFLSNSLGKDIYYRSGFFPSKCQRLAQLSHGTMIYAIVGTETGPGPFSGRKTFPTVESDLYTY